MGKTLLFVHKEKVPVRSQKYPHVNLSRSTTAFPLSAREYLERLGKGKLLKAELDDSELDAANDRWLAGRLLLVPIYGELYRSRFLAELELLKEWAHRGVSQGQTAEYNRRLNTLRKEAGVLRERLFETGTGEALVKGVGALSEPNRSEQEFPNARANLKKVSSREQELFKKRVVEILIRPMDSGELSRELRMSQSNLRKRMRLLVRSGLVKRTTQRIAIGRPLVVYFLSQDI